MGGTKTKNEKPAEGIQQVQATKVRSTDQQHQRKKKDVQQQKRDEGDKTKSPMMDSGQAAQKKLSEDKQLVQTNNRPAENPELQHQTKTKVLQQTEDWSEKTDKPSEDTKDNQEQTEQQADSSTKYQDSTKEKKLSEDRQMGQENKRSAENPELQNLTDTKGQHTYTTVNLVLLGLAGTGKSASGNTILGEKHFVSKPSSNPVTTECQVAETDINSVHVRVIDTPDMFDDDTEPSVRDKHVKRCKELCESELCVYVLVMHVSRFTDGERDILEKLENTFGTKVKEQTVILFTRGDDLEEAEMTLEGFLHSCQPGLKEIIEKCDNRCVVFENRSSSSDQVEKLMNTVSVVLKKTAKIQ
ncbi:immune-associated nucleotide-binding protein 9 isoform X2 [Haplochromis burtoni]|uniref:immune-associated nucleotide-binding protein 9 isoform X2 n=1 Tax=Haplochromis burtoni TaxID=8153 RepID=UPI0003BC7EF0|nr:immune-associated nucleotide-binding protein 9 isoform X2 [Haplochromis burtoni]